MSKTPLIREGGRGRAFAATKRLVTNKTGEDSVSDGVVTWVPVDDYPKLTKYISENGTYLATDDEVYAYSEITVNVAGGASGETIETYDDSGQTTEPSVEIPAPPSTLDGRTVTGIDPETGDEVTLGLENGDIIEVQPESERMIERADDEFPYVMRVDKTFSYSRNPMTYYYGEEAEEYFANKEYRTDRYADALFGPPDDLPVYGEFCPCPYHYLTYTYILEVDNVEPYSEAMKVFLKKMKENVNSYYGGLSPHLTSGHGGKPDWQVLVDVVWDKTDITVDIAGVGYTFRCPFIMIYDNVGRGCVAPYGTGLIEDEVRLQVVNQSTLPCEYTKYRKLYSSYGLRTHDGISSDLGRAPDLWTYSEGEDGKCCSDNGNITRLRRAIPSLGDGRTFVNATDGWWTQLDSVILTPIAGFYGYEDDTTKISYTANAGDRCLVRRTVRVTHKTTLERTMKLGVCGTSHPHPSPAYLHEKYERGGDGTYGDSFALLGTDRIPATISVELDSEQYDNVTKPLDITLTYEVQYSKDNVYERTVNFIGFEHNGGKGWEYVNLTYGADSEFRLKLVSAVDAKFTLTAFGRDERPISGKVLFIHSSFYLNMDDLTYNGTSAEAPPSVFELT